MSGKLPGIINFKPWHIPVRRSLRIAAVGVCILLAAVLFRYAGDFITVYSAAAESERYIGDDAFTALRDGYEAAKQERDACLDALNRLQQSGGGVALDQILSVAGEYRPYGINVLYVNTDSITGYGPGLDTVTRFISRLSEELGREVDIKNIRQLELTHTVVGFDLRF